MKNNIRKIAGLFSEENLVSAAAVLILVALLVFIGSNVSTRPVLGWTDPATNPPSANRPTPILELGNQTRTGNLIINNDLTVSGNVNLENNWFSFPNLSGARANVGDYGESIYIGSSTNRYFLLFTEGTYAGRFSIGAPASVDPAQNLRVAGTARITGAATTTGTLTLNNKANACKLVYYTATSGDTGCDSNHWVIGARDTSGVLRNPVSPPTPGYMICCRRY